MAKLNGCHSLPRHDAQASYTAQAGWSDTFIAERGAVVRMPIYVEIKTAFKPGCQYDMAASDAGCVGCTNHAGK